jgi:hypothetical protein
LVTGVTPLDPDPPEAGCPVLVGLPLPEPLPPEPDGDDVCGECVEVLVRALRFPCPEPVLVARPDPLPARATEVVVVTVWVTVFFEELPHPARSPAPAASTAIDAASLGDIRS